MQEVGTCHSLQLFNLFRSHIRWCVQMQLGIQMTLTSRALRIIEMSVQYYHQFRFQSQLQFAMHRQSGDVRMYCSQLELI